MSSIECIFKMFQGNAGPTSLLKHFFNFSSTKMAVLQAFNTSEFLF